MPTAQEWIQCLNLVPHPEGGHYRQTYRAAEVISRACLPERFPGDRAFSTAIYFLLQGNDFSALHRIRSDEVWHHYDGGSLSIHVIGARVQYSCIQLGKNLHKGEVPQAVVEAGCLFGTSVNDPASYALVGCTVAPGFDFEDFELPTRNELLRLHPQHADIVRKLTR